MFHHVRFLCISAAATADSDGLRAGSIEPRIATFPDFTERADFPQTICDSLRVTAINAKAFGQMAGVEGRRQAGWHELQQILGRSEIKNSINSDEFLVLNLLVAFATPAPSAMARKSPFFDLY